MMMDKMESRSRVPVLFWNKDCEAGVGTCVQGHEVCGGSVMTQQSSHSKTLPDLTSFHSNVLVGQPYKRVSVLAE